MHNGARSIFSFYPQDPRALQESQASRIGAERVAISRDLDHDLLARIPFFYYMYVFSRSFVVPVEGEEVRKSARDSV